MLTNEEQILLQEIKEKLQPDEYDAIVRYVDKCLDECVVGKAVNVESIATNCWGVTPMKVVYDIYKDEEVAAKYAIIIVKNLVEINHNNDFEVAGKGSMLLYYKTDSLNNKTVSSFELEELIKNVEVIRRMLIGIIAFIIICVILNLATTCKKIGCNQPIFRDGLCAQHFGLNQYGY